jgi:hypothetical protein
VTLNRLLQPSFSNRRSSDLANERTLIDHRSTNWTPRITELFCVIGR